MLLYELDVSNIVAFNKLGVERFSRWTVVKEGRKLNVITGISPQFYISSPHDGIEDSIEAGIRKFINYDPLWREPIHNSLMACHRSCSETDCSSADEFTVKVVCDARIFTGIIIIREEAIALVGFVELHELAGILGLE
jgi:hypothetical protein